MKFNAAATIFRQGSHRPQTVRVPGKTISDAARILYAAAIIGLGMTSLVFQDFAPGWQPVPAAIIFRPWLAGASGLFLLACGSQLLLRSKPLRAALFVTGYWAAWTLLRAMAALAHLGHAGTWLGLFENLTITGGALLLASHHAGQASVMADKRVGLWVRRVFGVACLVFGWCHFVYADITARMIPDWLPFSLPLTWLTGLAHIAAGVALLSMIWPVLAAVLEATMMTIIVLLVHLPTLGATPGPFWAPTHAAEWFVGLAALTIAASAWAVAASLTTPPAAPKGR